MIFLGCSETVFFSGLRRKQPWYKKRREKVMEQHITISVQKKKPFFSTRMTHDPFRLPDISFHAKLFPFQDLNYKP